MMTPSFLRQGLRWRMTTAGMTFFRSSGLPFLHEHMTRSPGAADGSLFSRPLMLITAITYRFLAPELSAQFITADMGRPSVIRSLLPMPGGLLLPPILADVEALERPLRLTQD